MAVLNRKFVLPRNGSDDPAYDEFLSAFGVTQGTEIPHEEATEENNDVEEKIVEENTTEQPPAQAEEPVQQPITTPNKSANAFAQNLLYQ